jgi:acyl-CoA synthetase (AMP-forming)/AMP-acid ligase II
MVQIEKLPIAHLKHPEPIELTRDNVISILEDGVKDGPAMTFLDRQGNESHRSYADLLAGARQTAHYLRNRGLEPGDKVILLLLTGEHFIDAFFGTILAGGVPVAVSPPMTFGDINKYLTNLQFVVQNSQARYMISFPRIRKVIGNVLAGENDLREFILAKEIGPETPTRPNLPSLDPDAPAFIQYTSGSTGLPKGAMLSHRALLSNVAGIARGIDCNCRDVSISWLPLFHDMGLIGSLLTALYSGAHLYTMLPEAFVMDPVSWLHYITKYRGTIATAPNFAYHLLASRVTQEDLARLDLSCLKVALNGAEPVDLRTLDKFEKTFEPVGYAPNVSFPVYGMAENCLAATFPQLGSRYQVVPLDRQALEVDLEARPAEPTDPFPFQAVSVGGPIQGQEVAIRANGGFAREKQIGEIVVKSPSLMLGYHRNPEATAAVIKDGWLRTGDLGFIHAGRLFITGRAKEMIIKRGRNYYPYDIERAASQVAGLRKGCLVAFSTENPETGTEDLVLIAETRETDEQRKQEISRQIVSEVLSAVGIKPDRTILVPPRSIPKTSSGKLQRLLTKQRYMEGSLVKGLSERWFVPVKTLVGSFIGNQRFRLRAR